MNTDTTPARAARTWLLSAVRGGAALAVGIAIVFVQDHSALIGLLEAVLLFALSAVAIVAFAGKAEQARGLMRVLAGIHALAAVAAAVLLLTGPSAVGLLLLLIVWSVASGLAELLAAKKAAQHDVNGARDWRFVALLTLAYAVLLMLSPMLGMHDPVSLTGLLGAYAAIIGVYLLIAAASSALGVKATRTASEVQS